MIQRYEIRFFTVGKSSKGGDAIFIRIYDENDHPSVIVIDGGYLDDGNRIIRYMVDECQLTQIDYVINTHPDIDHISGLITLFKSDEIRIGKLIMNRPWRDANLKSSFFKDGRITENSLNNRLRDSFKKAYELEQTAIEKIGEDNIIHPCVGNTYLGCFKILGPSTALYREQLMASDKTPTVSCFSSIRAKCSKYLTEKYTGQTIEWFEDESTSAINETSVILAFYFPDRMFLFTGDAGKKALNAALDYYESLSDNNDADDFDTIQLPHHGSRKNISPSILKRIDATTYYVSCPPDGLENGHYSRRLTNKILEINPDARIFVTSGTWLSHSEGIEIKGHAARKLVLNPEMDGKAT